MCIHARVSNVYLRCIYYLLGPEPRSALSNRPAYAAYTPTTHKACKAHKPPGPSITGIGCIGLAMGCMGIGLPSGIAAHTGAPISPVGTGKTGAAHRHRDVLGVGCRQLPCHACLLLAWPRSPASPADTPARMGRAANDCSISRQSRYFRTSISQKLINGGTFQKLIGFGHGAPPRAQIR